MEFCDCSDTRRAFSRACIAKSAYHKPSLSRRMGAALPLRPCGSATRRRRGPQRPSGNRAGPAPPGSGLRAERPKRRGKGILLLTFQQDALIGEYKMPLAFCLFEVRLPRSEIKFDARRPECARFCQANWPRQARDGAGPRSARTDSPMPAALSFFRCTALRAPCFHFFGTRRACLFFVV